MFKDDLLSSCNPSNTNNEIRNTSEMSERFRIGLQDQILFLHHELKRKDSVINSLLDELSYTANREMTLSLPTKRETKKS